MSLNERTSAISLEAEALRPSFSLDPTSQYFVCSREENRREEDASDFLVADLWSKVHVVEVGMIESASVSLDNYSWQAFVFVDAQLASLGAFCKRLCVGVR